MFGFGGSSFSANFQIKDTTGSRYVFTLPPYPKGQEPSTRPPPSELDPKLNGMTYTEAMRTKIQKARTDELTMQKPKPPFKLKFNNVKEMCYHVDPNTGQKILMGQSYTEKTGEYQLQDILKPYYADVNYASNPSQTDSQKLRSKTPAQLLDKFDPLPSDQVQKKIDFYFKPYCLEMNTKKFMTFYVNERDELLMQLKKKIKKPETSKDDQDAMIDLIRDIEGHKI
jgi:hypothetical protein